MRFTNRYSNGKAFIMNCALQTTNGIEDVIEKLAEYEDLEEQGRLVILPCKIGDTLFMIKDGEIYDGSVRFMRWENHKDRGIRSDIAANPTPYFSIGASFDDFGKTVFLTREEAEDVLINNDVKELKEIVMQINKVLKNK